MEIFKKFKLQKLRGDVHILTQQLQRDVIMFIFASSANFAIIAVATFAILKTIRAGTQAANEGRL